MTKFIQYKHVVLTVVDIDCAISTVMTYCFGPPYYNASKVMSENYKSYLDIFTERCYVQKRCILDSAIHLIPHSVHEIEIMRKKWFETKCRILVSKLELHILLKAYEETFKEYKKCNYSEIVIVYGFPIEEIMESYQKMKKIYWSIPSPRRNKKRSQR